MQCVYVILGHVEASYRRIMYALTAGIRCTFTIVNIKSRFVYNRCMFCSQWTEFFRRSFCVFYQKARSYSFIHFVYITQASLLRLSLCTVFITVICRVLYHCMEHTQLLGELLSDLNDHTSFISKQDLCQPCSCHCIFLTQICPCAVLQYWNVLGNIATLCHSLQQMLPVRCCV